MPTDAGRFFIDWPGIVIKCNSLKGNFAVLMFLKILSKHPIMRAAYPVHIALGNNAQSDGGNCYGNCSDCKQFF